MTNSFYSLAVHLVVGIRVSEEETSIPLLVDEEIREVHLNTGEGSLVYN